jgi:hypothetical protein
MPAKLVRLIRMIMEQSKGRIILENKSSQKFSVFKGVKEDDTSSTVFLTFRRRNFLLNFSTPCI